MISFFIFNLNSKPPLASGCSSQKCCWLLTCRASWVWLFVCVCLQPCKVTAISVLAFQCLRPIFHTSHLFSFFALNMHINSLRLISIFRLIPSNKTNRCDLELCAYACKSRGNLLLHTVRWISPWQARRIDAAALLHAALLHRLCRLVSVCCCANTQSGAVKLCKFVSC